MTNQQVEFPYVTGKTLSVNIFAEDSDTLLDTEAATEVVSMPGVYRVLFNNLSAGSYRFIVYLAGTPVYTDLVDLLATNGIYQGRAESCDTGFSTGGGGGSSSLDCSPYTEDISNQEGCTEWSLALVQMLRVFIGDFSDEGKYSDARLCQILKAAAFFVSGDICTCSRFKNLTVDYLTSEISLDPLTNPVLANFIVLKAACLFDQSTLRLRAVREGISAVCGPAKISVSGSSAYTALFQNGPCKAYDVLKHQCCIKNSISEASYCRMVVSSFVDSFNCRYSSFNRNG